MPSTLDITKALADESRLRLLMLLRDGELCLCQLVEVIELAPSTLSKHLSLLHAAGLVERRKEGKWHYYRLAAAPRVRPTTPSTRRGARGTQGNTPPLAAVVKDALDWVTRHMADEPVVTQDVCRLKRTLKRDLEDLCACYRN